MLYTTYLLLVSIKKPLIITISIALSVLVSTLFLGDKSSGKLFDTEDTVQGLERSTKTFDTNYSIEPNTTVTVPLWLIGGTSNED